MSITRETYPSRDLGPIARRTIEGLTNREKPPSVNFMDYRDRIVLDPAVRFGKPSIRGTRLTVEDVLSYLAGGMSEDMVLTEFPQLAREDIRACLAFAADRERRMAS